MRLFVLSLLAASAATAALAQAPEKANAPAAALAEPTAVLSRCAGKAGTDLRKGDPAFVTIAFDGEPWLTVDRTEEKVGDQMIATTVTGIGSMRRKDGTSVPLRFTCLLDDKGQAVMVHVGPLLRTLGDALPPALVIEGAASYLDRMALPRGVELQVRLVDVSKQPAEVLAEQVVRSGWQVPIPFSLRVPKETPLADRKLQITARFVSARQPLFALAEERILAPADLHKYVILTLDRMPGAKP
jgi:uncharacterized lipoprotein YbaY